MRKYVVFAVLIALMLIMPGCFLCRASRAPSDDNPAQTVSNQAPEANIESVSHSEARKGEKVSFKGSGTDPDGTVVGYSWRSSMDGILSNSASFDTTKLSVGKHIIYFQVIDNKGARSQEASTKVVIGAAFPSAAISKAAIDWESPDRVVFTWKVSNLAPGVEYWVYPHVGFSENNGPFGSSPEEEARKLQDMYDWYSSRYFRAAESKGIKKWIGSLPITQPHNPKGELALLAYDPATKTAWVVDISEPIDTSNW